MKKPLLIASMIVSFGSMAQFTQSNEPAIGESRSFFLCDSNATKYSNVTGTGVTWDYSSIMGVNGITKSVGVIDATTSPFASNFTGAQKAISIETAITTFFSSTSAGRISQGFVYTEQTFGDVKAVWSSNDEQLYNYPMGVGNSLTDNFAGSLYYEFNSIPQNAPCDGNVSAIVDGSGTLQLPGASYTNVLRYKMIDTAFTNVVLIGDLEVIREQYEYYDIANGNLPVFIHTSITMQAPGAAQPLTELSLVLSKDEPLNWLSVSEQELAEVQLFPNPTEGVFTVKGNYSNTTTVQITDASGRTVYTSNTLSNGQQIDLSYIQSGTYFVSINDNGITSTKPLTIK